MTWKTLALLYVVVVLTEAVTAAWRMGRKKPGDRRGPTDDPASDSRQTCSWLPYQDAGPRKVYHERRETDPKGA